MEMIYFSSASEHAEQKTYSQTTTTTIGVGIAVTIIKKKKKTAAVVEDFCS